MIHWRVGGSNEAIVDGIWGIGVEASIYRRRMKKIEPIVSAAHWLTL